MFTFFLLLIFHLSPLNVLAASKETLPSPSNSKGHVAINWQTKSILENYGLEVIFYEDQSLTKASDLRFKADGPYLTSSPSCYCQSNNGQKVSCSKTWQIYCPDEGPKVFTKNSDIKTMDTEFLMEIEDKKESVIKIKFKGKFHFLDLRKNPMLFYRAPKEELEKIKQKRVQNLLNDPTHINFRKEFLDCLNSNDQSCLGRFIHYNSNLLSEDLTGNRCELTQSNDPEKNKTKFLDCIKTGSFKKLMEQCLTHEGIIPAPYSKDEVTSYTNELGDLSCSFHKGRKQWLLQFITHTNSSGC